MLSKAIRHVSSKAKVCLFIDGLDEFEGEDDDLQDLVTWLKSLVKASPVKLCVASRPWRVFEDALQDRPHLLMENFNLKDIQQYVWRRFHDDPNFRASKRMDAAFCNQLLAEIVTKAEGVFLWVTLVCKSLLQAMSRGDLVVDLRGILNSLPVQMEKLYAHILDNLGLKDHAAKYFLLLQASSGRADALVFSFADDIDRDSEFSFRLQKEPLTDAQLQYRLTELKKRLNSRCKGLLSLAVEAINTREIPEHSDIGTVQYCHRSAKDYLTMDTTQGKVIHMLNTPFDPHLRLSSAYLARWKCCASNVPRQIERAIIFTCAEHAAKVSSEGIDKMVRVVDDLNPNFWVESYIDKEYFGRSPWFGGNLLSLTVVLGISEYVKCKVREGQGCMVESSSALLVLNELRPGKFGSSTRPPRQREVNDMAGFLKASLRRRVQWPLLLDSLLSPKQPDPEIVSLLLNNGADPNLIIRCANWEKSALKVILLRLREGYDLDSVRVKEAWVEALCLLLRHGARPDRSDVEFLREFIGEDVIRKLKVPRLGRHRLFISDLGIRLSGFKTYIGHCFV